MMFNGLMKKKNRDRFSAIKWLTLENVEVDLGKIIKYNVGELLEGIKREG